MTLNYIWSWSSNFKAIESGKYLFVVITSVSPLTTKLQYMLKSHLLGQINLFNNYHKDLINMTNKSVKKL